MGPQLQGGGNVQIGTGINVSGANPQQTVPSTLQGGTTANQFPSATQAVQSSQANLAAGNSAIDNSQAILQSIAAMEKANAPGVALTSGQLNLNALQAQAQSSAQNTVNPLYTQYLNQYLQQENANSQAAQAQNTLNIQGEQTGLQNTLGTNQLAQTQAANQNSLQQANINVQQQNYQLASGNAQTAKLQALSQQTGQGGLGASGLGQQQIYQAENTKNYSDAAQLGQFQYQRDAGNLSTQDTFDKLAQSSLYATTAEGQQEAQTNFNLNDYLRQAAYNDTQYQEALESSRQQAVTATTAQSLASQLQNAINSKGLSGKDYTATEAAYNNYLSPSLSLPTAPAQNNYLAQYGGSV